MFGTKTTTPTKKPKLTPADRLLCKLLAQRNAIFTAVRTYSHAYRHAWQWQENYHEFGIPWTGGEGADEQTRKRVQRDKDAAEQAGLLESVLTAGRTTSVKLTAKGELRAASLCSQFMPGDALPLYHEVARIQAMPGRWNISEDELLPLVLDSDVELIENVLLPLVIAGRVHHGIDSSETEVLYRITDPLPDGFQGIKADRALFTDQAQRVYAAAFKAERSRMQRK